MHNDLSIVLTTKARQGRLKRPEGWPLDETVLFQGQQEAEMSNPFDTFDIVTGDVRIPIAAVSPAVQAKIVLRMVSIIGAKKQHFSGFQFMPFREWVKSRRIGPDTPCEMASCHYPDHLNLEGFDNDTRVHVLATKFWDEERRRPKHPRMHTTIFLTSRASLVEMNEMHEWSFFQGADFTVEAKYAILDETTLAVLFGRSPRLFERSMNGLGDFVDKVVAERRRRLAETEEVRDDIERIRSFF